nr:hypothetical protein [Tanacetum cinerariifolium]
DLTSFLPKKLREGIIEGGSSKGADDREETPPLTKEQIKGHVSALKSLIKSHNRKNKGDPIRLDFETVEAEIQGHTVVKGKEVMDKNLKKPFKEARRTPFTCRIIEFVGLEYKMPNNIKLYDGTTDPKDHLNCFVGAANSGEWPIPVWCRMFQQTLDGSARGWFERLPYNSINEWAELREAFATSLRKHTLALSFPKGKPRSPIRRCLSLLMRGILVRSKMLTEGSRKEMNSKTVTGEETHTVEAKPSIKGRASKGKGIPKSRRSLANQEDVSEEPLIIEAEMEGIKDRLRETQMDLVGFTGEVSKPVRKIEIEARSKSPPSHPFYYSLDDEVPNPKRSGYASHLNGHHCCVQAVRKKQMIEGGRPEEKGEVAATEEVLINSSFLDQLVTNGEGLSKAGIDQLKYLLKDNVGVFAWEPSNMAGVPRRIIEHALNVNPCLDPVCQKRRTFSTEKRDGTWRMCIDFKNLNSACPKDYHPLPNIDCKVESVMGFKYKCFLDAYKEYHQIQMAKEDEEKTAFYTDQGIYCYTKMPFELKNAGATYQRLVDSAFQTQIGRKYVDDMVIKSKDEKMLLANIAKTFDNLKKNNMKLNPKKCSFVVEEGKFLGYVVTSEGVRANPKKTKALVDLQPSRTLKEMQSLNGKLASLSHFLAKSSKKSLPFLNTLKNITKENKHEYRWMQEAKEAFHQMKKLIIELPSLTPPHEKETLYAYLAVSAEAISVVLLTDWKGRKCPVQYVSRTLNKAERNYAPMEKLALSLIHMTQRLRRYFKPHPVMVIIDQPIKNILSNTKTSENLAKYAVELRAYNITFIPRNAMKVQVRADFLLEAPEGTKEYLYFQMPKATVEKDNVESWTLFTNGASSPKGSGASLVLIGPSGIEYTYALRLTFSSTNNEAEYEALLAGLRIAQQMNISNIYVKVDSKLMASQINGTYKASKDIIIKYLAKAREYVSRFKSFLIENIPRNMNQKAAVLKNQEVHTIVKEEWNNWMTPIIQCLEEGTWPKDKKARCLRDKISLYTMEFRVIFKKGYLVPMLRCVGPLQANYVIREIHMGSCGMHFGPRAIVRKAIRQGYYWPTMHEDAKREVEKCDPCQGMDILRPLPPASGGAKFVIVAIDYFTKWIEAKQLVKITCKEVIRFAMDNIICRFGLPRVIVTDNGAQLVNDPFKSWCGSEAVIPAEIGINTYQTLMIRESYNEEEMRLNPDLLQERREAAAIREAKYKTKMEQYYNRKVHPTGFRLGDFVFRRNKASKVEDQGKLGPKWEGPYRVVEAYENGS